MCRAVEETALIRPNQGSAAATINRDGNRMRQFATAARDTAKDATTARIAKILSVFVCRVGPTLPPKTTWASQTVKVLALDG
jgi:hypothetical protein